MGMKNVPDVIETNSEAALESKITFIAALNLHEDEENWDKIENGLKVLSAVTKGGAYKLDLYTDVLRTHSDGLVRALNSERSRVMSSAVDCLSVIAPRLGNRFDVFASTFIPTLLRLTSKSTKIYITRAKKCLLTIISTTKLPVILAHLRNAYSDKAQTMRLAVVEGLLTAMETYETNALRSRIADIETVMRAGATDSNADVRATCKKIYGLYTDKFEDRVDQFTDPLTPTIRKYLQIAPRNGNVSKKPPLPSVSSGAPLRQKLERIDADKEDNKSEPLSSSTGGPLRPVHAGTSASASTSNNSSDAGAKRFSKSTSAAQSAQPVHSHAPPMPSRSLSSSAHERHAPTTTSGPSRAVSQPTKPTSSSSSSAKPAERPRSTTPTTTTAAPTGARRPLSKMSSSSSVSTTKSTSASASGARRPAAGIALSRKGEQKSAEQATPSAAGYTRFAVKPLQTSGIDGSAKPAGRTMAAGVRAKILNMQERQERNSLKKKQSEINADKEKEKDEKEDGGVGIDSKDKAHEKDAEGSADREQKTRKVVTKASSTSHTNKENGKVDVLKERKNEKSDKDAPAKAVEKKKALSSRQNVPPVKAPAQPADAAKTAKTSRITKPPVPKFMPVRRKAAPASKPPVNAPNEVADKAKDIPLPQADDDELSDLFAGLSVKA